MIYCFKFSDDDDVNYQATMVNNRRLLQKYVLFKKYRCLICDDYCMVKRGRKLPTLPWCKRCRKAYFFQYTHWVPGRTEKPCKRGGNSVLS